MSMPCVKEAVLCTPYFPGGFCCFAHCLACCHR